MAKLNLNEIRGYVKIAMDHGHTIDFKGKGAEKISRFANLTRVKTLSTVKYFEFDSLHEDGDIETHWIVSYMDCDIYNENKETCMRSTRFCENASMESLLLGSSNQALIGMDLKLNV